MSTQLRPVYLVHGDDHGAIAERRGRLHALVAREQDGASLEQLDGDEATPAAVATALATLTFALGRRVILVEGVERWKDADVREHLTPAIASMGPDTTLALFAREEAKAKAPDALHKAVAAAGGQIVAHMMLKPWELPRWVAEQGRRVGVALDAHAAKALVNQVGERQQRLLRELEKLALEQASGDAAVPVQVSAEHIEARAARSASQRAYTLADAIVARDAPRAIHTYLGLSEQGERVGGLIYLMAQRMRDALAVAHRLAAGEPPSAIKRSLRLPSRAADRLIADVQATDVQHLGEALGTLADLELDTRGGSPTTAARTPLAGAGEDTLALSSIIAICRR